MTSVRNETQTEKRAELVAKLREGVDQVKDSKRFADTCPLPLASIAIQ